MRKATLALLCWAAFAAAQNRPLNVIAIGAHPDDCDIKFAGTAAKMAKAGHRLSSCR